MPPHCRQAGAHKFAVSALAERRRARNAELGYAGLMRLALLSDLHANLQALEAVLAHARRAGAERFALLGDLVGYGGDPVAVVEIAMALAEAGALVLRGNHDAPDDASIAEMSPPAAAAARWTRAALGPHHTAFLEGLPLSAREGEFLFVHADASAPERWRYVHDARAAERSLAATAARVVVCGHVHQPMLYALQENGRALAFQPHTGRPAPLLRSRRWHVVLGSVGQPRDGETAAAYALFDTETAEITFQRAPYDMAAAAARIRAAGLPAYLAERLFEGR